MLDDQDEFLVPKIEARRLRQRYAYWDKKWKQSGWRLAYWRKKTRMLDRRIVELEAAMRLWPI